MFDIKKLVDPGYLFDMNPPAEMKFLWPLILTFLGIIAVGLVIHLLIMLKKFHPVMRGFLKKIPGKLYSLGIVGLMLVGFRYEGSPYLSARILVILWILGYSIWAILFIIKAVKDYPRRMETFMKKNV